MKRRLESLIKQLDKQVIHKAHVWWPPEYYGVNAEDIAKVETVICQIKNHLRSQFPLKPVPHVEFEYQLKCFKSSVRIPLRNHICLTSEFVAMISGLNGLTPSIGDRPVPEGHQMPACILDAVIPTFTDALAEEFERPADRDNWFFETDRVSTQVWTAISDAKDRAICSAVDALDGITPECDRSYIYFMVRPRTDHGPADPFGSKSSFRNSVMSALLWWGLKKENKLSKLAESVTPDDLAYYFEIARYSLDYSDPTTALETGSKKADINERTVRKWIKKYSGPGSDWPSYRASLIKMIRGANYDLR
jgi:hypothetical protein